MCNFRMNILNYFAPYFADLKPCMIKLFQAMYHKKSGNPAHISHDTMIDIFTRTLEPLDDEKGMSHDFQLLLVNSPSRLQKHSLGIHNNLGTRQKKQKSVSLDPCTGSSAGGSKTSNSNWAVVPGNGRKFSGSSHGHSCGCGTLKSCSLHSNESSPFPC